VAGHHILLALPDPLCTGIEVSGAVSAVYQTKCDNRLAGEYSRVFGGCLFVLLTGGETIYKTGQKSKLQTQTSYSIKI
jgi:hypothetical protein